jgi:phosphate starvation-inducible PhoH-like protein
LNTPKPVRVRKAKFLEEDKGPAPLLPRTDNQRLLMDAISSKDLVVTTGFAGTGKTYVSTTMAADAYHKGTVDKIILTRPNVESGRSIGFRPGTMEEKMAEWMAEQLGILKARLGPGAVEVAFKKGNFEIVPFETMRGRSFKDAFVLLDEAENITPHEMAMFTTRLGENTKTVVNGDVRQTDLKGANGLKALVDLIRTYGMDVPVVEFGISDIVRSDLCKQFIINWMDAKGA